MSRYAMHVSPLATPQSEPIPGKPQVQNSAGGFTFTLDPWKRLQRFLVLGAEGGTYYASERKLTIENAGCASALIKSEGRKVVDAVVECSESGRAPKNDPAIFVLALCASCDDFATRSYALEQMPRVCRIGTHLFQFVDAMNTLRGWGRNLKRAVAKWYTSKTPEQVAFQVTKYQQRDGISHADVLKLCHPKTQDRCLANVFGYVYPKLNYGRPQEEIGDNKAVTLLGAVEAVSKSATAKEAAELIRKHRLAREVVPTQFLNEPEIWDALLDQMPVQAMVRNLGNLSKCGLLKPLSGCETTVADRLADRELVRKSRLHPLQILTALKTYSQGHGMRGSGAWTVCNRVVDALDAAFVLAFDNIEPAGKRTLLALDVSGSMSSGSVAGSPLTPREGAAAMAMVFARTEPQYAVMAFSNRFMPLDIRKSDSLADVLRKTAGLPFESTDCALPMLWAARQNLDVDTFVVITDNETWSGGIHPCQALVQYRKQRVANAKLAVIGMTATSFTIADPSDAGMLDFVGFDSAAPQVLNDFSAGRL